MAVGILPMPYGYYMLSRLVVCVCAIFFTARLIEASQQKLAWLFSAIAVLYNPLIPVYLSEKTLWVIVNIVTGIMFFINRNKINKVMR